MVARPRMAMNIGISSCIRGRPAFRFQAPEHARPGGADGPSAPPAPAEGLPADESADGKFPSGHRGVSPAELPGFPSNGRPMIACNVKE